MDPRTVIPMGAAVLPMAKNALTSLGGPGKIVGRMAGFGDAEMSSGAPWWALVALGAIGGGAAVWIFRQRIEKVVG